MPRRTYFGSAVLAALLFVRAATGHGQERLTPSPEAAGFSGERLARLDAAMQGAIDEGRLAGAVTMIVRRGHLVHVKAYGQQDREAHIPMRTDTIFRIASMTKTPTSIAVMMLMEEGRLLVRSEERRV